MRKLELAEIPPARETGRCDVVKAAIMKGLTEYRCHVKAEVFAALIDPKLSEEEKENAKIGKDIATLTRSCIGTAPTKPTAGLYHRLALIVCAFV